MKRILDRGRFLIRTYHVPVTPVSDVPAVQKDRFAVQVFIRERRNHVVALPPVGPLSGTGHIAIEPITHGEG
jgi:hypothetical protein